MCCMIQLTLSGVLDPSRAGQGLRGHRMAGGALKGKAVDGAWRLNGVSNRACQPIAFQDQTTTPMSPTPGGYNSQDGFFGWLVFPHSEHLPPKSVQQPVGVTVTRGVRPEFDAPPIRVRPR